MGSEIFQRASRRLSRLSPWRLILERRVGKMSDEMYAAVKKVAKAVPPASIAVVAELLPLMHLGERANLFQKSLEYLKRRPPYAEVRQQVEIAKSYLKDKEHFYSKVIAENFGRLAPATRVVSRLAFSKNQRWSRGFPSRVIPLGGKLLGRIVRVMPRDGYEAWLKAHNSGVPVEEILHKNGKPRAYKTQYGTVRVYTRYCGQRVDEFLRKYPKHAMNVSTQMEEILKKLDELGIVYSDNRSHFHSGNFTVEMVQGKPFVRIIDFNMAKLKNTQA